MTFSVLPNSARLKNVTTENERPLPCKHCWKICHDGPLVSFPDYNCIFLDYRRHGQVSDASYVDNILFQLDFPVSLLFTKYLVIFLNEGALNQRKHLQPLSMALNTYQVPNVRRWNRNSNRTQGYAFFSPSSGKGTIVDTAAKVVNTKIKLESFAYAISTGWSRSCMTSKHRVYKTAHHHLHWISQYWSCCVPRWCSIYVAHVIWMNSTDRLCGALSASYWIFPYVE